MNPSIFLRSPCSTGALVAVLLLAAPMSGRAQGALVPAAGPAPSMKTLAQIESRTDVNTLAGDAAAMHVITQPGSYYLTADVVGAAGKGGIRIAASDVTLDLNGFTVRGPGAGSGAGIYLPNGEDVPVYNRITVRNGGIVNWGEGGFLGGQSSGYNLRDLVVDQIGGVGLMCMGPTLIEGCQITHVKNVGIWCANMGDDPIVRNCVVGVVDGTGASHGIFLAGGGIVQDCRVRNVTGNPAYGIRVGFNTGRVEGCDASQVVANVSGQRAVGIDAPQITGCTISFISAYNGASAYGVYPSYPFQVSGTQISTVSGENAFGIYGFPAVDSYGTNATASVQSCFVVNITAGSGGAGGILARTIQDCTVSSVQGLSASGLSYGVSPGTGGLARNCQIANVEGHGVYVNSVCSVIGNSIQAAGKDGSGSGIQCVLGGVRIEGNRVSGSPIGVELSSAALATLVVDNFAQGNTTNYVNVNAALIATTQAAVAAGNGNLNVSF